MNEETKKKLNTAANAAMAVILLIAMIYFGIQGGNYLKKKLSEEKSAENQRMGENVRQAKSIWGIGMVFFVLLAVIYTISKVTQKRTL